MISDLAAQLNEPYILSSGLWSLAGFIGGYFVGRLHSKWKKDRHD